MHLPRRLLRRPARRRVEAPEGGARGYLDQPTDVVLPRRPLTVEGWALVGQRAPNTVTIVVNEEKRVSIPVDSERPDVMINLNEPAADSICGWRGTVDVASEPAGDLRLRIEVEGTTIADRVYALRGSGLIGNIDRPAAGSEIEGDLLIVEGWAHAPIPVARVEIDLDGTLLGLARLGLDRPDIATTVEGKFCGISGFDHRAAVPAHLVGDGESHTVTATALFSDGTRQVIKAAGVTFVADPKTEAELAAGERLRAATRRLFTTKPAKDVTARRLLVFTHSLRLGGGQLYLHELLTGIRPHLTSCTVVSPESGELAGELEKLGVDVVVHGRRQITDAREFEGGIRSAASLIRSSGCTSVLINTVGGWLEAEAAHEAGVPAVWAIHESFGLSDWMAQQYGNGYVPPYPRARLRASLHAATRLVFEADATRRMYLEEGAPADSAVVVPYGIDVDGITRYRRGTDTHALRRANGIPDDATVLLQMGIFEARKAPALLVEAFARVAPAYPDAVLVLVGETPGPYCDAVLSAIAESGVSERIITVPVTPDTYTWYALCDALVSASCVESLPRSMLEVMAFGKPVLSTSVFGVPELITDSETGWLMAPFDRNALAAGLVRVLQTPKVEREAMGTNAQHLVAERYRSSGYVNEYLRMIDEIEAQR